MIREMKIDDVRKLYRHFDASVYVTEFEKYKYFTEHDLDIRKFRGKIAEVVHQNQLTSVMNDTKWLKLQSAVPLLPFPPAYHVKLLSCFLGTQTTDTEDYSARIFDKEPNYYRDWSSFWEEGLPLFFAIEWMKVRPRYSKYRGQLVADKVFDETEEFVEILRAHNIPFEEDNGTFTIYGYR